MSVACRLLVPRKIKRSPTDLLNLLSKTISPTIESNVINSYRFIDDPFLLPRNANERRSYSLSRLSGERAARYVVNKFPFAFFLHKSYPEIPAYDPDYPSPNEAQLADPTTDHLITLLDHGKVNDAFQVYKALKKTQQPVDLNTKALLLECLSAVREDEWFEPSFEERWYSRNTHKKYWNGSEKAVELFEDIQNEAENNSYIKCRAICAMINGYSLSGSYDRSIQLYKEFNSELPCKFTLCNVIRSVCCLQLEEALRTLRHILETNSTIRPDAKIFSAIFYALDELALQNRRKHREILHSAVDCLAEMKKLGVSHSLGTLANLTKLLRHVKCFDEFHQIIEWAEGLENLSIEEPDDCLFFVEAMDMAFKLSSYELAQRLNKLLNKAENCFRTNGQMNRFNERLLRLAISMCPDSSEVESLWINLVPSIFTPSDELFAEFLEFLKTFQLFSNSNNWPFRILETIRNLNMFHRNLTITSKLIYLLRDEETQASVPVASAVLNLLSEENLCLDDQSIIADLTYILANGHQLDEAISILEKWPNAIFDKSSLDVLLALYIEESPEKRTLARTAEILKSYGKLGASEFDEALNTLLNCMILSHKDRQFLISLAPKTLEE